ncbi:MAG: aminotransferase class V-fold PLP-dependent enzyme [Myxococcota bacterium]
MTSMVDLDLEFVKSQFPAFSEPSLADWHFFENAGGSYACGAVIERLNRYYRQTKMQPYGPATASRRAGEQMDEARARWANYLNTAREEIHFGPSTTQNTYVLAQAFRTNWKEGDEIVVTDQDHEANIGAWRRLADTGIVVRQWSADAESGELDVAALASLLNERTQLVACTHCSNVVASPNPIPQIADLVHAAGAQLVVDSVAYAPHALPDLATLGADIYLFSLYKVFGPHQGLMYISQATMNGLANQGHYFNDSVASKRMVPAGPDHAQIAAAAGVIDYFEAIDLHHFGAEADSAARRERVSDLFRKTEKVRLEPLMKYLTGRGVRVLGPTDSDHRMPTVSMAVNDPRAHCR